MKATVAASLGLAARCKEKRRPLGRLFFFSYSRLRRQEACAVSWLRRRVADRDAAAYALARRQRPAALHQIDKQVEGAMRMRIDELELREGVLIGLDVVAVLDFVEA